MNQHLQTILNFIQQSEHLSDEEKAALLKSAKDANKELEITSFKLDRTEKVKRTTAILLEETIEELEQKRKAVEAQNRELEIESSLERVRTVAMSMNKADDMLDVCKIISQQLELLNVREIRNVQTAIFYPEKGTYMNYEYYAKHNKTFITETTYSNNEKHAEFAENMQKGNGQFFEMNINGDEVKEWIAYQKTTNVFIDDFLYDATSLNYYWQSLGPVALGISTYESLKEEDIILFKRFLKVFELAYRRYIDIEKAEAQTRESQIQLALERVRARTMAMHQSNELADTASILFQQIKELGFETWSCGFCIWKDDTTLEAWMGADSGELLPPLFIPYKQERTHYEIFKASQHGEPAYEHVWEGKELEEHYNFLQTLPSVKEAFDMLKAAGLTLPKIQCYYVGFFKKGYLLLITKEINPELKDISRRFAQVFDLTYTRFLDLQKAEAQAKESQIQLALERVRARTMAMQHSDELTEAASLLFKQVQLLDLPVVSCGFNIWQKEDKVCNAYMSDEAGLIQPPFQIPLTESPVFIHFAKSRQKEESFYEEEISGEALAAHYQYMFSLPVFAEIANNFLKAGFTFPEFQINNVANFAFGNLIFITYKAVPESHDIFKRFGKVFEQTYTRFLDLQKAEAQTREAQIEAALEKVRSSSLAMHHSKELSEVVTVVFEKLKELNFLVNEGAAIILTFTAGSKDHIEWIADPTQSYPMSFKIPYSHHSMSLDLVSAKESGAEFFSRLYSFEEKNAYFNYLFQHTDYRYLSDDVKKVILESEHMGFSVAFKKNSAILVPTNIGKLVTDEQKEILKRFSTVFEQTYTRFLDLQKAEAQSRENQIQLALERVRARTMAMQHSDELAEAAQLLYQQFESLGIQTINSAYMFVHEDANMQDGWAVLPNGSLLPKLLKFPLTGDSVLNTRYQSWKEKKAIHHAVLQGEENKKHHSFLANHVEGFISQDIFDNYPDKIHFYNANFSEGYLFIITTQLLSAEEESILSRFAKVFEQTYTRFLDLQKAEAQAREAQIEAALERVRSKAMMMQKSEDLSNAVAIVFEELDKLNMGTLRCGISIINKENHTTNIWSTTKTETGIIVQVSGDESMDIHPLLQGAYDAWLKQKDFSYFLHDEDLQSFYTALAGSNFKLRGNTGSTFTQEQYMYVAHFPAGGLYAFRDTVFSEEAKTVVKRFADVFNLTYTRFKDLQQAEAQAREAKIEAALERVRSRTLAMQKSDELAETSAVLFQQLIGLGISPNRLYISIMKDDVGNSEFWITDEDSSKVSMAYEDNLNNNPSFKKMYDGWKQQKKSLVIDMKGKALKEYLNHLTSIHVPFKGGLTQKRRLQYIAYFSKGFIGMASPDEQPAETLQLLERFAYVFNLTFTRFNDLQIAEAHAVQAEHDLIEIKAARTKAEETLAELQSTQKQLVQSEKMASLGELTAGIAHEIQNPLNFVNNFSEVSNELISEMVDEVEKGNTEEAKALANDIKQNLEKINHHGRRADAIVKGMLQHSRKSEGIKEPTDINALCDEYLRLSYHGLRAKDKDFNADFKTDFDESIGKINIVPQDIGRVLLNLFNNAFYATSQKQKTADETYKPIVSVQTKKTNDKIEIRVSDNGNGIPQNIIDKIFQPFFTTKPTGQGTGLGLSLAYDIITKEHNGTIKVESKEGEGSVFIIQLPGKNA